MIVSTMARSSFAAVLRYLPRRNRFRIFQEINTWKQNVTLTVTKLRTMSVFEITWLAFIINVMY